MNSEYPFFLPRARHIIGIDEAGCGPLAGPVVVAGVRMTVKRNTQDAALLTGIKDSKKLTARQREKWYGFLTTHPGITWAAARVWPRVIDRINIRQAARLGARRIAKKLGAYDGAIYVVLDGGLVLPAHILHETIIKGDERVPIIAAASIIAKVTRDRIMLRLHKKYPEYRFDLHKGYGTRLHRELIRAFGRSPVHRVSFRVS